MHVLLIPVSVSRVKVWSQTRGAGAPHSVQRWLQVTAPPQQGSRERNRDAQGQRMRGGGEVMKMLTTEG